MIASVLEDFYRALRFIIRCTINSIMLIVFSPLVPLIIYCIFFRRTIKKKNIIFSGLEHIIAKTTLRGQYWIDKGYNVIYYSLESLKCKEKHNFNGLVKASNWWLLDGYRLARIIKKFAPMYVEIYYRGHTDSGFRQWLYVIICRISHTMNAMILRGELYYVDYLRFYQRFFYRRALNATDFVLYRETYMPSALKKLNVRNEKVIFDPNKVNVKPFKSPPKTFEILYLNSFHKYRNVDLLVKAIPIVLLSCQNFSVRIVGAQTVSELDWLRQLSSKLGVDSYVTVEFWTSDPVRYYSNASIFVLPADVVYLNFSLLEAMERGLTPIIADVTDANKIINNGYDGYICDKNEKDIAERIIYLLKNPDVLSSMGRRAHEKVEREFNDYNRMIPIENELQNYYSNSYLLKKNVNIISAFK